MRHPIHAILLQGAFAAAFCPGARAQSALEQIRALAGPGNPIVVAVAPRPVAAAADLSPRHAKNTLPRELNGTPLIVVHAVRGFDENASAASGIDALVASFKAQANPVIYLLHDQSPAGYADWYTGDRRPDYELFSEGGEHNLPIAGDAVTVVGGYFGSYDGSRGCQTLAVRDAIRMHFEASERPFTVFMPVRALYFYDEDAAMRGKLLSLDAKTASEAKLREIFDDFASLFFLTDNFSDVPAFGHPYPAGPGRRNGNYREGASVDVDGYTFELFFGGRPVSRFGHGPRKVSLKLYN